MITVKLKLTSKILDPCTCLGNGPTLTLVFYSESSISLMMYLFSFPHPTRRLRKFAGPCLVDSQRGRIGVFFGKLGNVEAAIEIFIEAQGGVGGREVERVWAFVVVEGGVGGGTRVQATRADTRTKDPSTLACLAVAVTHTVFLAGSRVTACSSLPLSEVLVR